MNAKIIVVAPVHTGLPRNRQGMITRVNEENDIYEIITLESPNGSLLKNVPMAYIRPADILCSGKNVGKKTAKDLLKDRLFRIPTYQRRYAWNKFDWNGLWNDLGKPNHSMGNVTVYEEEGRYIVIDGQ